MEPGFGGPSQYDVMIPFTRQVSGPMDYTQGAMRNASKGTIILAIQNR